LLGGGRLIVEYRQCPGSIPSDSEGLLLEIAALYAGLKGVAS